MARSIKNPGIFAADAQTTIPATPVVGVPYRNEATGLADIRDGWPFKTIVDSADFAQILHELTTLTDLIDRTGILEWKNDIEYDSIPAYVQGSDGLVYKSTVANGPAATVVDPVGDLTGTWALAFGSVTDDALLTLNNARRGNRPSVADFNSLIVGGIYDMADPAALNNPSFAAGSHVLVTRHENASNTVVKQIASSYNNNETKIRTGTGGTGVADATWSAWEDIGAIGESVLAAENGYSISADGIIEQWGKVSVPIDSTINVTLPTAFPTNFFNAIAGNTAGAPGAGLTIGATVALPNGLTQITLSNDNATQDIYWRAKGN